MTQIFFYGALRHPPLLAAILGRPAEAQPASIADHAAVRRGETTFADLVARPGVITPGVLVSGISEEDRRRLDYAEHGLVATLRTVDGPDGVVDALVYISSAPKNAADWNYEDWAAQWADIATAGAQDFMKGFGTIPASEQVKRVPRMLPRGASRLRAAEGSRPLLGRAAPDAVDVIEERVPYANYFSIEEYDLSFRRFDGGMSEQTTRAVFITGDAATVLPYDPVRDRVLLVEQFRAGPFARGDAQPWVLEPIAGRIDAGETALSTVIREAEEEAGLTLGEVIEVARFYPSPGCMTEYVYCHVAIADLPDSAARVAGLEDEAEDIRGRLMSFDELMELAGSHESGTGPLLVSAWWLMANRARLREAAEQG